MECLQSHGRIEERQRQTEHAHDGRGFMYACRMHPSPTWAAPLLIIEARVLVFDDICRALAVESSRRGVS